MDKNNKFLVIGWGYKNKGIWPTDYDRHLPWVKCA